MNNLASYIDKLREENPLLCFSGATHTQICTLNDISETIFSLLDIAIGYEDDIPYVEGTELIKADGYFWFWVLGAYEVLRTMSQAKNSFTTKIEIKIDIEKRYIAEIRMPFAKQEYKGKRKLVSKELCLMENTIDYDKKDVLYQIEGKEFSFRETIKRFNIFVSSLKKSDVIHPIEIQYK